MTRLATGPMRALFARLVFATVFGATWILADSVYRQVLDDRRATAAAVGTTLAAATQRQLDRSLSTTVALGTQIRRTNGSDIDSFEAIAASMMDIYGGIDNLQLAPDGVVSHIYPLEGNEQAIGHDLLNDPARRAEALATIQSRALTLAGPFELVQGGEAVIGRYPVFIPDPTGVDRFWGFAIALIHMSTLLGPIDLEMIGG